MFVVMTVFCTVFIFNAKLFFLIGITRSHLLRFYVQVLWFNHLYFVAQVYNLLDIMAGWIIVALYYV